MTPVYRRPSGYSETYLDHLNGGVSPPKVLLDPELAELPLPVPLPIPVPEPRIQLPFPDGIEPDSRIPFDPEMKSKKPGKKRSSQKR